MSADRSWQERLRPSRSPLLEAFSVVAGERQRCLDAGANDYVPKPVDTAELISVLRPWLHTAAV